MKNKFKVLIILSLIFLGGFVFLFFNFDAKIGYEVCIYNNTEIDIENLEVIYASGESIEIVSKIEAGDYCELFVATQDLKGENFVILKYKDYNDNIHEEHIIGYLERGYSGYCEVNIDNIDVDGKLNIQIKEKY